MKSSKLKLNSDKTEFIIIGTKHQRQKLSNHFPVKLLDNDISPSDSVRNLGVIFDSDFSFHKHVSNICKSCFYHIRDLRQIRRHIPLSTAKTISNALISSRLNYCNSLINNIAKQDLSKLQRVQNCLARVILRAPRFSPSLPLLKQLHWLPVNYRIKFKLCILTFRALAIHQPPYLASLLHFSNIIPFAAPMCSIVNLRMLLSTRFFGGFTIPWGPWMNSTWLSSGRPWAIGWICKLVPPLLKRLFSSISWQLCIISSQKLCLHICFHGQKMLSYEYAYMCMQMRADIIEKPNFVNIWKTMHDNIMKLLSTHMFPWSRIIILSLKMF